MQLVINDGGRALAGYRGYTGDCITRAIAIALQLPYQESYNLVNLYGSRERITKRNKSRGNARIGILTNTIRKLLGDLGWQWVPTMQIGSGCKVHLIANELPRGRLIVRVSKHLTAVIDGVLHDNEDCSRAGTRCVYGYWLSAEDYYRATPKSLQRTFRTAGELK